LKLIGAGIIGNVLEWYDFAVYGFFAHILAKRFFPSEDPIASLIASYGAFAAGFRYAPSAAGSLNGSETASAENALWFSRSP